MPEPLLHISDLSLNFSTWQGRAKVLDRVDLTLFPGDILGLVGETGCGKSVTARAVMRLVPQPPAEIVNGRILFQGDDILKKKKRDLRRIRGNRISMIFQEPMTSLNPVFTVGNQMTEVIRRHQGLGRSKARGVAEDMLRQVRLPDPEKALKKYPHELSGGMRQRAMIAMELSGRPDLLIADEPTTALDVTVQGQVLTILEELARERNMSVLFITHDLGVVAQVCDRVAVMYAGQVVEVARVGDFFHRPVHPYAKGLLDSVVSLDQGEENLVFIPGTVPHLISPPLGCRFHPRCREATEICRTRKPEPLDIGPGHVASCHARAQVGGRS